MASIERGGGETYDIEIARHLQAIGHDVMFLTGLPLVYPGRASLNSLKYHAIRSPYLGWLPWEKMKAGWRLRVADFWIFEWLAARWIMKRSENYDVIQICEMPHLVHLLKERRCPLPVVMRLTAPHIYDPWNGVQQADQIIASGTTMRKLREEGIRPDAADIPNGVDLERFKPTSEKVTANERKYTQITNNEEPITNNLIYVARFQDVKNHEMLIRAMPVIVAACPDVQLLLAGSGPLKKSIQALAEKLGCLPCIGFLGEIPHDQLPEYYRQASINILPSKYESFSFTTLEAMACGLPVVATDTEWVPYLLGRDREDKEVDNCSVMSGRKSEVRPQTSDLRSPTSEHLPGGIVVPVNDHEAMAMAVIDLLENPELRQTMGARNRAEVEKKYGWQASAEKLDGLYREVPQL